MGLVEPIYIYTYGCSSEDEPLCKMEFRALFNLNPDDFVFQSRKKVKPSRSPFLRERIEVLIEGNSLEEIYQKAGTLSFSNRTFKTIFVKTNDLQDKISFNQRRKIEREVGLKIKGDPDLEKPDIVLGIVACSGEWYVGIHEKNEAVWLHHQKKPREYSTALSTRMARAVVNIAVPDPEGIKAIDPCCGIGTVLVEALSMGIDIIGRDIKPLPAIGARENVAHFGYSCEIKRGAIEDVTDHYDAAIIDLPYNLCHTASPEEQLSILKHAHRIADRVVVVTGEPIDDMMKEAGLIIRDRCEAKKIGFTREILLCYS